MPVIGLALLLAPVSLLGCNSVLDLPERPTCSEGLRNCAFAHQLELRFDNSARTENLIDFPVLVTLTPSRVSYQDLREDAADIVFLDGDLETILAHEIETWNPGGESLIWVKVPQIDGGSAEDRIVLVYGNSEVTNPSNPGEVWSDRFETVHHFADMSEGATTVTDSTRNGRDGTILGPLGSGQGPLGNALRFGPDTGDGGYATLGDVDILEPLVGSQTTIEMWFQPENRMEQKIDRYYLYQKQTRCAGVYVRILGDGTVQGAVQNVEPNEQCGEGRYTAIMQAQNDQWYRAVLTIDRPSEGNLNLCIDVRRRGDLSTLDSSRCAGGEVFYQLESVDGAHLGIADPNQAPPFVGTERFEGLIDEFRVSSTIRSADWIDAQHASMNDALITYGDE
ncbi:MAG: DUF2341 domain-containing protein [Myxococcota bacterium]